MNRNCHGSPNACIGTSQQCSHDIVHGDLSPYNVLYDGRDPVIIDVPQAMDSRQSLQAYSIA